MSERSLRQSSLAIDLAGRIRALIQLERFASGRHLTAREFADRFDVSRPPIEQALQLLAAENIVTHIPNRGYFVGDTASTQSGALGRSEETYLTRIYFRLAEDRLNHQLPDQVSETYLRKTYGLAESDLRSLINRIVQEGWAERRPGYGWTFSSMLTTPHALEQNYRVRLILEPAGLLEPEFSLPADKAELCRMNEEELLSGKIDQFSPDVLYERGVQFHHTLAEASNNPFLVDALRRLHATRRLLAYRTMVDRSRHYRQAEQHLQILKLLTAKRNEEAATAMRAHLQGVMISLRSLGKNILS